ncbi:transcription factor myb61 [Quercus suber]|uniref:Transcription factor myb61 n=1 Tax=Quercus suber TaxID=58331 RepID=A0AAW0KHS2_QUESU
MNSEYTSNAISTILPPSTSSYLPPSIGYKPSLTFPTDNISIGSFNVNGSRYWETTSASTTTNNSNSSSGSSSSAELQHNSSLLETSIQPEDIKWTDYLNNPLLVAAALQNQTPQSIYNEIKSETQLVTESSSAMWPHSKQQGTLQTSDICGQVIENISQPLARNLEHQEATGKLTCTFALMAYEYHSKRGTICVTTLVTSNVRANSSIILEIRMQSQGSSDPRVFHD